MDLLAPGVSLTWFEASPGATRARPVSGLGGPSASMMIFSGSMPEPGSKLAKATTMPLPRAEPRCKGRFSIALNNSSRWVVGAWATDAVPDKLTMPTLTCTGCSSMKMRTAASAASKRLGGTSVARMLPEVSMASMTESKRLGSSNTACGRASASKAAAKPKPHRHTGMLGQRNRRQRVAGAGAGAVGGEGEDAGVGAATALFGPCTCKCKRGQRPGRVSHR